jgi:hypothetical protein
MQFDASLFFHSFTFCEVQGAPQAVLFAEPLQGTFFQSLKQFSTWIFIKLKNAHAQQNLLFLLSISIIFNF